MSRSRSGSSSTTSTLGRGPALSCSTSAGSTGFSTFCKTPFKCHQGIEFLLKRLQVLLQTVHILLRTLQLRRHAPLVLQISRDHESETAERRARTLHHGIEQFDRTHVIARRAARRDR